MLRYYHKLLRHCFLPPYAHFDVDARRLSFCAGDYPAVKAHIQLLHGAIEAEQPVSGQQLTGRNLQKAHGMLDAGYLHISLIEVQPTKLYVADRDAVDAVVVHARVLASFNNTEYRAHVGFVKQSDGTWAAEKNAKRCECVTGSELNTVWCAHMACVFVALARVLANTHLPFEEFVRAFPDDILLVQAQAVRLILALTFDEGHTGNGKYRTTTNRGGRAELQVGTIKGDVEKYLADGTAALLAREHLSVLRRHRQLMRTIDVTTSPLNDGIVAFYADE